jgi:hypothetical protein
MQKETLKRKLYSKTEAAFVLGWDKSKINRLCDCGLLIYTSDGKTHKIFVQQLDELLGNILANPESPDWCKNQKQKNVLKELFYNKQRMPILTSNEYSRN